MFISVVANSSMLSCKHPMWRTLTKVMLRFSSKTGNCFCPLFANNWKWTPRAIRVWPSLLRRQTVEIRHYGKRIKCKLIIVFANANRSFIKTMHRLSVPERTDELGNGTSDGIKALMLRHIYLFNLFIFAQWRRDGFWRVIKPHNPEILIKMTRQIIRKELANPILKNVVKNSS